MYLANVAIFYFEVYLANVAIFDFEMNLDNVAIFNALNGNHEDIPNY